ncbi:MAG: hypothetical protein ACE3L7_21830 [Candidatus Pristimantibacillus sp.]
MTHNEQNNEPTKAEVQTTKLNKMPIADQNETEFSAEQAAEVFEQEQQQASNGKQHQQE